MEKVIPSIHKMILLVSMSTKQNLYLFFPLDHFQNKTNLQFLLQISGIIPQHKLISNAETARGDYKWSYYSTSYPFSWYEVDCDNCDEINLELQNEIRKLREINLLAGFDLDWMVEEFESREDVVESFVRGRDLGYGSSDSFVVIKSIKKGCVGSSRKMLREIRDRYKRIEKCKDIGDKYIVNELV